MAGAVHSYTRGGTLGSPNLTVTCPASPPGSVLALCICVHGRNDMTTRHAYSTTQTGWNYVTHVDNYNVAPANPTKDYWQLWLFTRTKASGDTSWVFPSKVQLDPTRTWVMVALTGVVETPGSSASAQATNQITAHTFTGLTMNAAGDLFLGFSIVQDSQMSVKPALTHITSNMKSGNEPKVYPARISSWYKVVAASGGTGNFDYTADTNRDYCSLSLEFNAIGGSQTASGSGPTMGEIVVPGYAGFPKISAANATRRTAFDIASADEQNVPVLLATISPLESDVPGAATSTERFSSGWHSRVYHPAIRSWPEITRSLYGNAVVGGKVGFTAGELALLNDRESVPGDSYGVGVFLGATMVSTATGFRMSAPMTINGTSTAQLDAIATSKVCGPSARARLDATATGVVVPP